MSTTANFVPFGGADQLDGGTKDNLKVTIMDEFDRETLRNTPLSPVRVPTGLLHADTYDKDLLHRAVKDAGRWAFGVVYVEVWVLNDKGTHLFRPEAGWWLDPIFHQPCYEPNCDLCRLANHERPDFLEPRPLSPGVGLPGILYQEARNDGNVTWRNVKAMVDDPDLPDHPRMVAMIKAKLGWAAGIPFKGGLVVYTARESVDLVKMQQPYYERYMIAATELIGAAWALRGPRYEVLQRRQADSDNVMMRARRKLAGLLKVGFTIAELEKMTRHKEEKQGSTGFGQQTALLHSPNKNQSKINHIGRYIQQKIQTVAAKTYHGGSADPPPPKSNMETLFSFIGVFWTLLMITTLHEYLVDSFGSDWGIVLGPFGALMTLQYGLTPAPASQPWSAICGQTVSLTIALAMSYLDGVIPLYIRQAMAVAFSVAAMSRLGCIHPPAGAASLLFVQGRTWSHIVPMLMANVLCIIAAALWNNLNDKRQYPTYYWGISKPKKVLDVSKH